jgi:hypothetical protein
VIAHATQRKRIIVSVVHVDRVYEVRVTVAGGSVDNRCTERTIDAALKTARRYLEQAFRPGDSLEYASALFDNVDDVMAGIVVARSHDAS